jgi:cytochrome c6
MSQIGGMMTNGPRRGLALAAVLLGLAPASALAAGNAPSGNPSAGRLTFVSICSSCHGLDGIATYEYAPSFAKGQRLNQDDATLLVSVRDGLGRMPPWGVMLSEQEILDAIAYARTLQAKAGR